MKKLFLSCLALALFGLLFQSIPPVKGGEKKNELPKYPGKGFVVHEWGVYRYSQSGKTKISKGALPNFVENTNRIALQAPVFQAVIKEFPVRNNDRKQLEKPIVYFYSPDTLKFDCNIEMKDQLPVCWYPKAEMTSNLQTEIIMLEKWLEDYNTALKLAQENILAGGQKKAEEAKDPDVKKAAEKLLKDLKKRNGSEDNVIITGAKPSPETEEMLTKVRTRLEALRAFLKKSKTESVLSWKNIGLGGNPKLAEVEQGHWFHDARDVNCAPLTVDGESEKFLFYETEIMKSPEVKWELWDGEFMVRNAGKHDAFDLLCVEVKDGKVYLGGLEKIKSGSPAQGVKTDKTKALTPDQASDLLVESLVNAGLYGDEALSMTKIWRKDFFETEGLRVLYRWSPAQYDELLPMTLSQKADEIKRVMLVCLEQ